MKVCLSCQHRFDTSAWDCPKCHQSPAIQSELLAFAPDFSEASEGFEPEYHTQLYALEAGHFWFRARNQLIIQTLNRFFPNAKNLLEIGCGTGYVLSGIQQARPDMELYGSEVLAQGLHLAKIRLPSCQFFQMDARRIPFENEFDLIGAFDVLEHIEEDTDVLRQMRQAVRRNTGGILLTVPQHPFLWGPADEYARHVRRYRASELRRKVEQAGFDVKLMTSFVSLLLPALLLSRGLQRNSAAQYDPMAEFNISQSLNQALEHVMTLERHLIKRGLRFCAGGSLLLAATVREAV